MNLTLSPDELLAYTSRQLNHFFPDGREVRLAGYKASFDTTLDRLHHCFQQVTLAHYCSGGETKLNHLHADQYLMFLWFFSNTLWRDGAAPEVLNKFYCLNKALHAFDCVYNTALPDIFLVFHGCGTMLGKASYSNYFVALHGCTVGSHNGTYPVMGAGVALTAHSALIGDCQVGDLVSIGCGTTVMNHHIPSRRTVFRDSNGKLVVTESRKGYAQSFFTGEIKAATPA